MPTLDETGKVDFDFEFNQLLNAERQQNSQKIVNDLTNSLKEKLNQISLEKQKLKLLKKLYIDFVDINSENLKKLLQKKSLSRLGSNNHKMVNAIYILIYLFSVAADLAMLLHGHMPLAIPLTQTLISAEAKNYDESQGLLTLVNQLRRRQYLSAVINGFGSLQFVVMILASQHASLVCLSATLASGLLGLAAVAYMAAPLLIEYIKIRRCDKTIKTLNERIEKCSDQKEKIWLRKSLALEEAIKKDHKRSAESWLVCSVAMMTITLVAFGVVGGVSFGTVPAVILVIMAASIGIGIIRNYYVSRVNNIENLKNENFAKHHMLEERLELLKKSPSLSEDKKKTDFIQSLIKKSPQKALCMIMIYEGDGQMQKEELIKQALSTHKNSFWHGGFGRTASLKKWLSLTKGKAVCC